MVVSRNYPVPKFNALSEEYGYHITIYVVCEEFFFIAAVSSLYEDCLSVGLLSLSDVSEEFTVSQTLPSSS
jgi:hypothetical protein